MGFDLIIFDCDGTLVNSHDMNHTIMAELANEFGGLSYTAEFVEQNYLGVDYFKFFQLVAEKENITLPDNAPERCVEHALQNIPTMIQKIDGVLETLQRISPHYKFAVASNANKQIVLDSLSALNIDKFFNEDDVIAGRAMATPKPAPDLFLMAANQVGVEPDKCLVIEDSPTGTLAGVAAGMEVWGFVGTAQDQKSQEKRLIEAGATRVFSDFIHMGEALGH
jgi:HAD superfamily hydrolase (TIGR01509 family)